MLYCDRDKYGYQARSPVVEAYNAAIKDLVRSALEQSGGDWASFVFASADELITAEKIRAVESQLLNLGYRFDWSAPISARERPEAYKPLKGISSRDLETFTFEHPEAPRETEGASELDLCGVGDNVVRYPADVSGTARYIRSPDQVLEYLKSGVPPDTIALIDDSGGTLTAPILQRFKGIICAGGSTRSHLGILAREYGVPCLMNAKVRGVRHGDQVIIEVTAQAKTAAEYQSGRELLGRIWRKRA